MKSGRNIRTGLFIAISVSVVAIVAIMLMTMDHETWEAISEMSPLFFFIAFALIAGKWLATCVRTRLLIRASGSRLDLWKTSKAVLSGGFTGAVTPFHAAGIPTEIYFLYKYGLTGPQATAVVTSGAAISIVLFIVVIPFVFIASIARIHVSMGVRTLVAIAGIIGFFFLLFVAYSMKEPARVGTAIKSHAPRALRSRPSFNRNLDRFLGAVADFSESLQTIIRYKKSTLVLIVFLTFVFWALGFMVTPVILWGLGYPQFFWDAMLAQLVVSCLQPFMPIPGESGMAEAAFVGVFAIFVPEYLLGFLTLAWRFFMFYLVISVTGVIFLIALRDAGKTVKTFDVEKIEGEVRTAE